MKNLYPDHLVKNILFTMLTVGAACNAHSGTIDEFSTQQAPIEDTTPGDGGVSISVGDSGNLSILGGSRDTYLELLSGVIANASMPSNFFGMSVGTFGSIGTSTLQWDGVDNSSDLNKTGLYTAGAGVDLTENGAMNAFSTTTIFADHNYEFTIGVYTNDNQWTEVSFEGSSTFTSLTNIFEFSHFTNPALCNSNFPLPGITAVACGSDVADLTNVGAVQLTFDPYGQTPELDVAIALFETISSTGCLSSIGDTVWIDENRNGIQNAGEALISGATVNLYDSNNTLIKTDVTDANGNYLFSGLCSGIYSVDVDESTVSGDLFPTLANAGDDALDSDSVSGTAVNVELFSDEESNITIDFGYQPQCTGNIGNYVWHDQNRDGIQDPNEAPIVNALVTLSDALGNQLDETLTDANGHYNFTGLCAGEYNVDVDETTIASEFIPTSANEGNNDSVDSDSVNGAPVVITLTNSDHTDITIDFGFNTPCTTTIGDTVWLDENRNGIQNVGEPGISGAVVYLLDIDDRIITHTTTDADGNYLFMGLCADVYRVDVDETTVPATLLPTDANNGDDALDSDSVEGASVEVVLTFDEGEELTIDFGFQPDCSGALGDFVWHDLNRDGIQDAGEPPLVGVRVVLKDSAGAQIAEALTDANGYYNFSGLCFGEYIVDVDESTLPTEFVPTPANVGNDDAIDSDAIEGNPVSTILFTSSSTDLTIDFGFNTPCMSRIGDKVWLDENRNGVQDHNEPAISGVTVNLYNDNGDLLASTTTDANGIYAFTGLCSGDYSVDVDESTVQESFFPTAANVGDDDSDSDAINGNPVSVSISNDEEENQTIDFGFQPECMGKIGDFVWHDLDRNGIQDPNEPPLVGVRVVLKDAAGNIIAETNSDTNGYYTFDGLCEGTYIVDVDESTVPTGLIPTVANQGGDDSLDSDAISGDPVTVILTNSDNENFSVDFGFFKPCNGRIGDRVWLDENRNGIQDSGESNIAGANLNLFDSAGNLISTTQTNTDGNYEFNGLCAGDYSVEVDGSSIANGLFPTIANIGDDAFDSDSNNGAAIHVTLANDESVNDTIDFGYQPACTGKIGDYIWQDSNRNGIQDMHEPALANVRVVLLNNAGNPIAETFSDSSGYYVFDDLCAGNYAVDVDEATLPSTLVATEGNQGGNDNLDSDAINDNPVNVVLPNSDQEDLSIDFGFIDPCTGQLGDTVWLDENRNGLQDPLENSISNATVNLFTSTGDLIATTTTDISGNYLFSELCAGDYRVDVDESSVADELFPTTANAGNDSLDSDSVNGAAVDVSLALDSSDNLTIDFGFQPACAGSIGDYVWQDLNRNGVQELDEPGIANVRIVLKDAANNVIAEALTDGNGYYLFGGLCAGNYRVDVDESTITGGLTPTPANQGSDDATDSDSVAGGAVFVSLPSSDSANVTIDFGFELVLNECDINVEQTCIVMPPPQSDDLLCEAKIAATTFKYIGPSMTATVRFEGKDDGFAEYSNVELISGETVLSAQNGFTIDSPSDLGSKTNIYVNGVLSEVIHTSCSAVYRAGEPAPLDSGTPTPPDSEKGDPSPNWHVIDFRDKEGSYVSSETSVAFPVTHTEMQKYLVIATGNGNDGSTFEAFKSHSGELGANQEAVSSGSGDLGTQQHRSYTDINLDLSNIYVPEDGLTPFNSDNRWTDADSDHKDGDIVGKTDFLPGAKPLHELPDYLGNIAITGRFAGFKSEHTDYFANVGVQCRENSAYCHLSSTKDNSWFVDNASQGVHLSGSNGVSQFDPTPLLNEVTAWRHFINGLSTESTITDHIKDQNYKDSGTPYVTDLDMIDSNNDGFAIIDIAVDSSEFKVENSDWIIKTESGVLAIFRLVGAEKYRISKSSVMMGPGCSDANGNPLQTTQCQDSPINQVGAIFFVDNADKSEFVVDDTILGGVALWDLATHANSKIELEDVQGCSQLISSKVELKGDNRLTHCQLKTTPGAKACNIPEGGADVSFNYLITNNGEFDVNILNVSDSLNGNPTLPSTFIAAGQSLSFNRSAQVGQAMTNTVLVEAKATQEPAAICEAYASTHITVVEDPTPSTPVDCGDIKPLTELSMVWTGPSGTTVTTAAGQVFENLQQGNAITFTVDSSEYGNDFEVFLSGAVSGSSEFHLSCSDDDMDGTDDCGSAQGNNKGNEAGLVNSWLLDGMTGESGSFTCGLDNTGVVEPDPTPEPPATPVDCGDIKPLTELSMVWTGPSGTTVTTAAGQVFENLQQGNVITFTVDSSEYGNDFEVFLSGAVSGSSEFHLSCSDDDMDGTDDCGSAQGNNKGNEAGLVNSWLLDGMTGESGSFTCGLDNTGVVEAL